MKGHKRKARNLCEQWLLQLVCLEFFADLLRRCMKGCRILAAQKEKAIELHWVRKTPTDRQGSSLCLLQ